MVYKHPIQALKEDFEKILDHAKKQVLDIPKGKGDKEKLRTLLEKMEESIMNRTQVELQRQQRRETEDAVFVQGETIKTKDDAQDMIIETLKKKFKDNQISKMVHAEQIKTTGKDKKLFKVQMKPRKQHEMTLKKDGKEIKTSQTTALFSILREKPENSKRKGKQVDIQRQTPAYLQEKKKKMDLITRDLRNEAKCQTKTSFNVKDNILVAKFREDKNSDWISIFENTDKLPEDIAKRVQDTEWNDYVLDEKKCINNLLNF